jgi:protein phosphatase
MKSWTGTAAARSDRGRVRRNNEDAVALDLDAGLFVVCDGMGGVAGGEIASRRVADEVLASYRAILLSRNGVLHALEAGIQRANVDLFRLSDDDASLRGMGTTVVALALSAEVASLAHVGDSRCYRLRSGILEQLTHDHSFVAEQVARGTMTAREAIDSPMRNVITRAVGTTLQVEAELREWPIQPGDIYLLATDGLNREVDDRGILQILHENPEPGAACDALVAAANESGGRDNVTCIVVRIANSDGF